MPDFTHIPPLLIAIVLIGLAFDFTNGFHDTANAVATVVSTRVLTPGMAILMCAILNFAGALISTKVAQTIAKGIVESNLSKAGAFQEAILAAIIGAIAWNLLTWYFGIPSSSSHALIGGLVGATWVFAGVNAIIWKGVLMKVIVPMVLSPVLGGLLGFIIMTLLYALVAGQRPDKVNWVFHNLQRISAAAVAFNHGQNDAQKTMGVITLALVTFHLLPGGKHIHIPLWVIIASATAMGLGTASGGWRIIKTLGTRIIRLEPINGFAAETAASIVLATASQFGAPVSTTHIVSGSIFGVGISKRLADVRWPVATRMVTAWVLTLPGAALVAAISLFIIRAAGHTSALSFLH